MFILIELDWDWTVGIDWYKHSKGIRLGFIAIHIVFVKHTEFVDRLARHYAKEINQPPAGKGERQMEIKCDICKGKKKIPTTGSAMYWPDRFPDDFKQCPKCNNQPPTVKGEINNAIT